MTLVDGIIAGGTAGVVVETALYPIDTIKTRLQVSFICYSFIVLGPNSLNSIC